MNRNQGLVLIICLLFNFSSVKLFAQITDTVIIAPEPVVEVIEPVRKYPKPKIAAIKSAILPGWGQAYNGKYWKIPIIYVAGGVITYFYITNAATYRESRDLLEQALAENPNDPNINIYRINRDRFREWRDWNIAMLVGLYILNIIDANVDAHLKEFDVGDDLSFTVKPYLYPDLYNSPVTGLTVNLKFKK